jgi:hypothetical protein
MMKNLILIFCFMMSVRLSHAQLLVENNLSAAEYIQNVLLGPQVFMSNLTVNSLSGDFTNASVGEFDCSNCAIGMESGLIIGNGDVALAPGPNNIGYSTSPDNYIPSFDEDMYALMDELSLTEIYNMTVIEFDFVAINESLQLQLVWASEEYDSYVNSNYGDFCGVFLSGQGINGVYSNNAVNLAQVPVVNLPISVNTINNGAGNAGPCENCELYNQYQSDVYMSEHWSDPHYVNPYYIQYDGWTVPLNIDFPLVCGETYHLKLGVANANDYSNDSGLFIRKNINTSNQLVNITTQFDNGIDSDFIFYESCGFGSIVFERPVSSNIDEEFNMNLSYSGTAVNGIDFTLLPDQVSILPGEMNFVLPVEIFPDMLAESDESFIMTLSYPISCGENNFSFSTEIQIEDVPADLEIVSTSPIVCPGTEQFIAPLLFGGSGNFDLTWSNGSDADTLFYQTSADTLFELVVLDLCTGSSSNAMYEVYVFETNNLTIEVIDSQNSLPIVCEGTALLDVVVIGGATPYSYLVETPTISYETIYLDTYWVNEESSGVHTIHVSDYCASTASVTFDIDVVNYQIELSLPDTIEYHCGQYTTIEAEMVYSGQDASALSYAWYLDNVHIAGPGLSTDFYPSGEEHLEIQVSGDCINDVTESAVLVMLPYDPDNVSPGYIDDCSLFNGCTDMLACNYSPAALFADTSCFYEIPAFEISGQQMPNTTGLYGYTYDTPGFGEIIWSVVNGEITGGQGTTIAEVVWSNEGSGTLMVQEVIGDCTSELVMYEVIITSLSENDLTHLVNVFPSPTVDVLNIILPNRYVASEYTITDGFGRIVGKGSLKETKNSLDVSTLSEGQYVISFSMVSGSVIHKKFAVIGH